MQKKLYVVTCISNPVRYKSRYRLYREFAERMQANPLIELWTAEMAYGDRPFEITQHGNPHHLQLRSAHELWHKENLQNLMVQRLPADGVPVAFIDADVTFLRHDWAEETLQLLQHYDVVQMFSHMIDLDSDSVPAGDGENLPGFAYVQQRTIVDQIMQPNKKPTAYHGKKEGHGGYAWAWRRSALDTVGGLIDFSIVGSADWQMACGLYGEMDRAIHEFISPQFGTLLREWGDRAKDLRRNIGYVPGYIAHYWHGPKSKRGYYWRYRILHDAQFDPQHDLVRDWQGLFQLRDDGTDRHIALRDGIRQFFRSRDEDEPSSK